MNLQDILTYREYPDKESKSNTNTKENNLNTKRNSQESNNINNDVKNNSSNYSYTRSNKIEKEIENKFKHNINNNNNNNIDIEIHSNNVDINNNINSNNNNILNIPINRFQEIEKNNENEEKKDIIDELIEKIKNKEDIRIGKEIPRKTLSELDEELKLGLDQLKKIQTKSNKASIFSAQKGPGINGSGRNSLKFNELIIELSKTNTNGYKGRTPRNINDAFLSYKNIKIAKPNIYFQNNRKSNKTFEVSRKRNEKLYFSSIDGNVIINGERKNPDTLQILIKKLKNPRNRSMCINDNLNLRRSNSVDLRTIGNKSVYPYFGIRKINNYNKNYFMDELNKIDNLLL
jgi:hypothetical protein